MPGTHLARWPDDRVARELEAYFAQRAFERWPTYRTFVRDGRKRLHEALMRAGGPERWGPELGVPLIPHPPGAQRSDDQLRADLCALMREHRPEHFPTMHWLRQHAPRGIPESVKRTGGVARWARELRMPPPPYTRWTDDLIEQELRRLTAGTTTWPTRAAFDAAGTCGLRRAIYEGYGSRYWAERVRLTMTRARSARAVRPAP